MMRRALLYRLDGALLVFRDVDLSLAEYYVSMFGWSILARE